MDSTVVAIIYNECLGFRGRFVKTSLSALSCIRVFRSTIMFQFQKVLRILPSADLPVGVVAMK